MGADDVNGFRVQAPAPVFEGVQAAQIAETEDVIAAKAAFAQAYAAQEAAVAAVAPAERKRRSAQVVAAGLPYAYAGLPFATGLPYAGLLAGAPAAIVADIAHATPEVVAAPALTYSA